MEKEDRVVKKLTRVATLSGGSAAAIGLLALVGWHTHSARLVQIHPSFAVMVYNTALGLFLGGLAVLWLARGSRRLVIVGGVYATAVGLLTLSEYAFGVNLAIDQLLMNAYLTSGNAPPGRMAINTALCLWLVGMAILLLVKSRLKHRLFIVGLLGGTVAALGAIALSGYFSGISSAYSWGNLAQIAMHTAVTFIALGAGLVALAWRETLSLEGDRPRWLPLLTGVAVAVMSLCLWQALTVDQRGRIESATRSQAESIKEKIVAYLEPQALALQRMAERWETDATPSKAKWETDATHYVRDANHSLKIYWIDASLQTQWVAPTADNESALNRAFPFDPQQRRAVLAARNQPAVVALHATDPATGRPGIHICVPLLRRGEFDGFLVGVFREQEWLNLLLTGEAGNGYPVTLADQGQEFYRGVGADPPQKTEWAQETPLHFHGLFWRVRVWPDGAKLRELQSLAPQVALAIGLLIAGILAGAVYLAQQARLRTKQALLVSRTLALEIAERQRAEAELRRARDELEQRVKERTAELEIANGILALEVDDRRQAEQQLRGLAEGLPLLAWTCQGDGPCDYLSPQWVAYTGIPEAEQLGFGWLDQLHADDREPAIAAWNRAVAGNTTFDVEFRIRRADGVYRWFKTRAVALRDATNRIVKWFGTNTDIEDQKQVETALRESEDRYRDLIENSQELICTHDLDGLILSVNQAALQQLGYDPNGLVGRMSIRDIMVPEYRDRFADYMDQIKQHGRAQGRMVIQTCTGEKRVWEYYNTMRTDGVAAPIIRGMAHDVTEHLKAEEQLKRVHDELEMRVQHRTAQLLAANTELEAHIAEREQMEVQLQQAHDVALESARLKSEFVANMSHEIRTPMNGIIGLTEIALQTELAPEQRQYLNMVKASADSLLQIINDILDFSKIEAGKLEFEHFAFSLRETLDNLVQALSLRAQEKGLELTCYVAADVPDDLIGDPGRLRQVMINLVSNAIKFTERGSVSIRVDKRAMDGKQALLRFTVTDTGIGIPLEKQKVIFDSFVQADGSTARQYGGTGLGLSISSRLVEMMGSALRVTSEIGKGSKFFFTVWFERAHARPAAGEATATLPAAQVNRRLRILLAEDNEINQWLAVHLLESRGHQVVVAENGRVAVGAFEAGAFDVVLMDVQMPQMSGLEATAAIRERERATGAHIPIIAVTAHAMKGDQERCLAAGMDEYISKPIRAQELFQALDRLIAGAAATTEVAAPANGHKELAPETLLDHAAMLASVNGNQDFLRKLVGLFLKRYPQSLTELREALAAGDSQKLARAAHTLRGSGGNFLTSEARSLLASLEAMGKTDNLKQADATLAEFESEIPLIERELNALVGEAVC